MKTLKTTLAAGILFISTMSSFAAAPNHDIVDAKESKNVVAHYVEANVLGTMALDKSILSDDFVFEANNKKFNKAAFSKFSEKNKGLTFNCETSYEILEQTGGVSIAKITMDFENFTRIDYVTLMLSAEGWKVSNIKTSYK